MSNIAELVERFKVENGSLIEISTNKVMLSAEEFKNKILSFVSNVGIDVNDSRLNNEQIVFNNDENHKAMYRKTNSEIRDAVIDNSSLSSDEKMTFIDSTGKELLFLSNAMLLNAVQEIKILMEAAVK